MITVLLYILLAITSLLLIMLLILLLAPIHFDFKGACTQELELQGKISWAGGLLRLEMVRQEVLRKMSLHAAGIRVKFPEQTKRTSPRKKHRHGRKGINPHDISSLLNRQLLAAIIALISKLLKALHLDLKVSGIYGFDDPSLTGILTGMTAAVDRRNDFVSLHPDFTGSRLEIEGIFRGWFIPLQLAAIATLFLFQKPVRVIWRPKISFTKKKNHKEVVDYA